jgi:hypothetical protein
LLDGAERRDGFRKLAVGQKRRDAVQLVSCSPRKQQRLRDFRRSKARSQRRRKRRE